MAASIKRIVEVLTPFARAADVADEYERADDYDIEGLLVLDCGDLRAARDLLREIT